MNLDELRKLPDGAIVKAGLYVYQKHDGRFKSWFCVAGHTAARMLDPNVVRQPVEVIAEFPHLSRDIAAEIEAERQDMGEGVGDVYYAQGLQRAAEIARRGR